MTDNEIIKALECCISHKGFEACESSCPFYEQEMCLEDGDALLKYSLDLINRQQAEIERLKAENQSIKYCYERAKSYNDTLAESCEKNCKKFNMTTRAEAIKEFAERLKRRFAYDPNYNNVVNNVASVFREGIDDLVAEMTGETFTKVDHNSLCETETFEGMVGKHEEV